MTLPQAQAFAAEWIAAWNWHYKVGMALVTCNA